MGFYDIDFVCVWNVIYIIAVCVCVQPGKSQQYLSQEYCEGLFLQHLPFYPVGPAEESSHYKHNGRKPSVEEAFHRWFLASLSRVIVTSVRNHTISRKDDIITKLAMSSFKKCVSDIQTR